MNNTDIVTKIDEELLNELTKLGTLDPNADEAKDLIKNIQALHQMRVKEKDLSIEDSKIQNDYYLNQRKLDIDELKASNDNKIEDSKIQNDYYLNQRKLDIDELKASNDNKNERIRARDARILQLVGFGVTLGTFAIGWGLRSKWLAKGFKFEETGTFSSKTMMECFKEVFKKN